MGCWKTMNGTLALDHDRKEEYRDLIEGLKEIATKKGELRYNGAIVTIAVDHSMPCGEAENLDYIVKQLGYFAVEPTTITTRCDDETWEIKINGDEQYADPTNEDRANRAMEALKHYDEYEEEDLGASISSMVADLLHLGRREGLDPDALIKMGRLHFEAETDEEEDENR